MNKDQVVIPKGMEPYYERFHFAPAVRSGDRLLASGQIGSDAGGAVSADPEAQFDQAFRNVGAVLEAAGLGFGAIVEMTTYHVGLQQHLRAFQRVKDRYLREPYPAWTAIGVTELAIPGGLVEIRVVAERASR
jgi:enamine deaminase RidA (YjgF/YER057c/UK114 family)